MLQASDVSMPSPTCFNVTEIPEFKIQFHPRSGRPPLYQPYEEFRARNERSASPVDETPWPPFCALGASRLQKLHLLHCSISNVKSLLDFIARVTQGAVHGVTLKNDEELRKRVMQLRWNSVRSPRPKTRHRTNRRDVCSKYTFAHCGSGHSILKSIPRSALQLGCTTT